MSIDGKISGDTSEFSYHIPCPLSKEVSLVPISGVYQGYFWMKYKPPQKIVESKMQLVFTENGKEFIVSGTGSNRLGSYDLHGVYDPETQELSCYKEYHHHASKTKSHRSETPKETRSSTRYVLSIILFHYSLIIWLQEVLTFLQLFHQICILVIVFIQNLSIINGHFPLCSQWILLLYIYLITSQLLKTLWIWELFERS